MLESAALVKTAFGLAWLGWAIFGLAQLGSYSLGAARLGWVDLC